MRRPDPLTSQFSITSVIVMLGVKVFVIILVIVIGGMSFMRSQTAYAANPRTKTPSAMAKATATPLAPPDTEWGKALSTQVQSQLAALTPLPNTQPSPVALPTAIVQITPTASNPAATPPSLSSPLMGISLEDLPGTISQDFSAPPTGEDTGHHGVDFAFWSRGSQASILGLPITSVFSGRVASAFNEIRPPYGYLTIIETPLSTLPPELLAAIKLPPMAVPVGKSDKLSCPTGFTDQWNTESQSLYLLYAHMNKPPTVTPGQTVKAGDVIGEVGNTGASSAPHLHLEMRIGPSNASFASIGHYDPSTSDQERHNYCTWRISGVFQMFNPMTLLSVQ